MKKDNQDYLHLVFRCCHGGNLGGTKPAVSKQRRPAMRRARAGLQLIPGSYKKLILT
jgi:hypothetical protein